MLIRGRTRQHRRQQESKADWIKQREIRTNKCRIAQFQSATFSDVTNSMQYKFTETCCTEFRCTSISLQPCQPHGSEFSVNVVYNNIDEGDCVNHSTPYTSHVPQYNQSHINMNVSASHICSASSFTSAFDWLPSCFYALTGVNNVFHLRQLDDCTKPKAVLARTQ